MSDWELEHSPDGYFDVMKSDEVTAMLEEIGVKAESMAGTGYAKRKNVGKTRTSVTIKPETKDAKKDNRKNNTLLKVFGGI